MPDDKRGREKQARDADRRQRARAIAAELERMEETEPPVATDALDDLETELDEVTFPATGAEVVEAVGERTIPSDEGLVRIGELVPETATETFAVPADVTARVQRPTIAAMMKRIVEANAAVSNDRLGDSRRKAYEKTLRALKSIDADDEDEGVEVITDWIVEQTHEDEQPPGSRSVRRRAAEFCRENGYEIRNDEWLGI
ncbi:hypothetical protein NDI56_13420 [Haloarcula sp. S1CR25-12]|uniref:Uncharacterized protein n=1 Tax=Haloarcula saliterrae TaxID=2950534 RepID=A0ABU2FDQ8_9EURY|nr:hypothetical protein [Haloarcula sp. S1CR25-12]MDS0260398.1 hypothetical protein [Haloarcula sp. S1CR25-12]